MEATHSCDDIVRPNSSFESQSALAFLQRKMLPIAILSKTEFFLCDTAYPLGITTLDPGGIACIFHTIV